MWEESHLKHHLAMASTVTAAIIALAACSGSSDKTAETAATTSPAAMAAASAPASGPTLSAEAMADMDKLQPGKWQLTNSMAGQAMPATEVCIDKPVTFQEQQDAQKQAGVSCSENNFHREGDKILGHSVCTMKGMSGVAPMTMTSDFTVTGDLKTAYTMDMTTKITPPPAGGMGDMKMTISARRIGDCDPAK